MRKGKPTGYQPLYTLKPVAPGVWIADGGWIRFCGLPFPTRMTVVRLADGQLWVHSPIAEEQGLFGAVSALGPVSHLVAPNWIHYAWLPQWQRRFPEATAWLAPGVAERASRKGVRLHAARALSNEPPPEWAGEMDQRLAESSYHSEVVFFHRPSRTLVLTDLIENFESHRMPWWTRPLLRLGRVRDPDGRMPRDMAAGFRRYPERTRELIETMIGWNPQRIILAHGRWYQTHGTEELRRAFRDFLE